jgi:hypothetical protein
LTLRTGAREDAVLETGAAEDVMSRVAFSQGIYFARHPLNSAQRRLGTPRPGAWSGVDDLTPPCADHSAAKAHLQVLIPCQRVSPRSHFSADFKKSERVKRNPSSMFLCSIFGKVPPRRVLLLVAQSGLRKRRQGGSDPVAARRAAWRRAGTQILAGRLLAQRGWYTEVVL